MSAQVPPPLNPEPPGTAFTKATAEVINHKRLPDFESFDRIEFRVVPRYKTSGMSGDEWRQHVQVDFFFKGEKVHEKEFRDMQTALMMVGAAWVKAQEPIPMRVIEIESTKCDQPSCAADAVVKYLLKVETSDRGDYLDPAHRYGRKYRQFCKRHARRGDCSREDADKNYERVGDFGPKDSTNLEESPSATMVVEIYNGESAAKALDDAIRIAREAREIYTDLAEKVRAGDYDEPPTT